MPHPCLKKLFAAALCLVISAPGVALASLVPDITVIQPKMAPHFTTGHPLNEAAIMAFARQHPESCQAMLRQISDQLPPDNQIFFYTSFVQKLVHPANEDLLLCKLRALTFLASKQAQSGAPEAALASYDAILKMAIPAKSLAGERIVQATRLRKASLLTQTGQMEQAQRLFSQLLDAPFPQDPVEKTLWVEAFEGQMRVFLAQNNAAAASAACDRVIAAPHPAEDDTAQERYAIALYYKAVFLARQVALLHRAHTDAPAAQAASTQALTTLDTLLTTFLHTQDLAIQHTLAFALSTKASLLVLEKKTDQAVAALDTLITIFAANPDPALQNALADAYGRKISLLRNTGKYQDAIKTFSVFDRTMGQNTQPFVQQTRLAAVDAAAWSEHALGHTQRTLDLLNYGLDLMAHGEAPEDREKQVSFAYEKTENLRELGRNTEAFYQKIDLLRTFYNRFPTRINVTLLWTLKDIYETASGTDNCNAAQALFDDLLAQGEQDTAPTRHMLFLQMLYARASLSYFCDRKADAFQQFGSFITTFRAQPDQFSQILPYLALHRQGVILAHQNRNDAAMAVYDQALADPALLGTPEFRVAANRILLAKSFLYSKENKWENVIPPLDLLMERETQKPFARSDYLLAASNRMDALNHLHRPQDAVALGQEVLRQMQPVRFSPDLRYLASVLDNMADAQQALKQPEQALATYDTLITRFWSMHASPVPRTVARVLYRKARLLQTLGKPAAANATLDRLIQTFQYSPQPQIQAWVIKAWDETHPHPFLP
ncbi:tetratricopeptide repeat protein [Acetobacter senegalensis]|uniref:tetratricopeptide repeat protein n=1 Tax=Acetobacter senegalensis TaxID=446692 RepID=UPI001EDBFD24|nr:tetratricopeptide repeat protein [Acetobacter senegalensis]MCG4254203.1 tetratricopeptide repeat protein [Acetobacter senegalensis]